MKGGISAPGPEGFRANVAAAIVNGQGQILLARRIDGGGWQLPQGGIDRGENPEQALFRELQEELGLRPSQVRVLAASTDWHRYRIPPAILKKRGADSGFQGQSQRWFLLQLAASEEMIRLDTETPQEFDRWRWAAYWHPVHSVPDFKREAYRRGLTALCAAHLAFCGEQQEEKPC